MKIYFSLLFLIFSIGASAQDVDTLWISQFKFHNNIYYQQGNNSFDLAFVTKATDSNFVAPQSTFTVNSSVTKGVGLNYKFISLSFTYNTLHTFGNIDISDLSFTASVTKRSWGVESFYGSYHGLINVLDSGKWALNKGIQFDRAGAKFHFIRKYKRYSWRAPRDQSERQRKASSSLVLFVTPSWQRIQSSNVLLPNDNSNLRYYQNQAGLKTCSSIKLDVMPGWAFTIQLFKGRFYFSPVLAIGTGLTYNDYYTTFQHYQNVKYTFCKYAELNYGYNGARFYVNVNAFSQTNNNLLEPVYFQQVLKGGRLTLGFRFGNIEKIIPEDLDVVLQKLKKKH